MYLKDSYKTVFDTVIVWMIDCLSRNRYDSARYKIVLKQNGVRVILASKKISEGAISILFAANLEKVEYSNNNLKSKIIGSIMQTIKYKLADGKTVDIEVSDEVAEVYAQIVTYEKKVHRKETRRHNSLEHMQDKGFDFADENGDVEDTLEQEARYAEELELDDLESEREELYLNRKRHYLENNLTPRQAQAYFEFTYLHLKKVRIAENMHITEGAVQKLILKAGENLTQLREKRQEEILQSACEKVNKNKRLNKRENEALNLLLLQTLFAER